MSASPKKKQEQSFKARFSPAVNYFAIVREIFAIYKSLLVEGSRIPWQLSKALIVDSSLDPIWAEKRFLEIVGDLIVDLFNDLGPVYGKAAQVTLSRIGGDARKTVNKLQLDRLYGQWPAMPWADVERILDQEIPDWHQEFVVDPYPIGVASMAQVHVATDESGKRWVIKMIKPHAEQRLHQTLDAIEQMIRVLKPFLITSSAKRAFRELSELVKAMRVETDLLQEMHNIDRMRERLAKRKQQVLILPETLAEYCTKSVLTVELFEGTPLSELVNGTAVLSKDMRKKLAKKVLNELLVQVFEIGLFHGDPHAGNLILLDDGTVGVFDWGLTGELLEADRKHISSLLKALMAGNLEKLVECLAAMAEEHQVEVDHAAIEAEIDSIREMVNSKHEAKEKQNLQELLEACLTSAERLSIPVPDGLLMMAKSLLTIEGLARGIDPEIAMARVATPVLFRAAKPGFRDIVAFSKRIPKLMKRA